MPHRHTSGSMSQLQGQYKIFNMYMYFYQVIADLLRKTGATNDT